MALTLATLGMAGMLATFRAQSAGLALSRTRTEVLGQAGELLNRWLEAPRIEPGQYPGATVGDRRWLVTVEELAPPLAASLEEAAEQGETPGLDLPEGQGRGQSPGGEQDPVRRAAFRAARLLKVRVCCVWPSWRGEKSLCLESERLQPSEAATP